MISDFHRPKTDPPTTEQSPFKLRRRQRAALVPKRPVVSFSRNIIYILCTCHFSIVLDENQAIINYHKNYMMAAYILHSLTVS